MAKGKLLLGNVISSKAGSSDWLTNWLTHWLTDWLTDWILFAFGPAGHLPSTISQLPSVRHSAIFAFSAWRWEEAKRDEDELESFGPCGNSSQDQSRWLCALGLRVPRGNKNWFAHSFVSIEVGVATGATPIFAHRPNCRSLAFHAIFISVPKEINLQCVYSFRLCFLWPGSFDQVLEYSSSSSYSYSSSPVSWLRYSSLSAHPPMLTFWQFSNIFAHMHVLQVIYLTASTFAGFNWGWGIDVCLRAGKSHPWRRVTVFCQPGSCVLNPQQHRSERPSLIKFYINRRAVQRHANNQRSPTWDVACLATEGLSMMLTMARKRRTPSHSDQSGYKLLRGAGRNGKRKGMGMSTQSISVRVTL